MTISELLRSKDLIAKKVVKNSSNFLAVTTVVGTANPPKNFNQSASTFQSTYDFMTEMCKLLTKLRKANICTFTDSTDFFSNEPMSVIDCRQSIVGDKNVGLPSTIYYLKELYNHLVAQTKHVADSVKRHNDAEKQKLRKILDDEYNAHIRDKDALSKLSSSVSHDFETAYEQKVQTMTNAFWAKNSATYMDPLNIFQVITKLINWLNDFERTRELKINKANNGPLNTSFSSSQQFNEKVSLEELISLVKDQHHKIKTELSRLWVVTWKIGDKENHDLKNAGENLQMIFDLIEVYGKMQSALRVATTLTVIDVKNPLTDDFMSIVDIVDFKHNVLPVIQNMVDLYEKQKTSANNVVSTQEVSLRTDVMKILESTMSSSNTKPTMDKMKEYASGLMESLTPKIVVATDVEKWIEKYQKVLDFYECEMRNALSTANANTNVSVSWKNVKVPAIVHNWDNVNLLAPVNQLEVVTSMSNLIATGLEDIDVSQADDWGASLPNTRSHNNKNNSRFKRAGRGRGL